MRSWGSFRVILNAEDRLDRVAKSCDGLVVEVNMCRFATRHPKRFLINAEPMVLARNLDSVGKEISYRLIRSAMSELQLIRGRAERKSKQLVSEADAKCRDFPGYFSQGLDRCLDCCRITRTIRDEQTIWLERAYRSR